METSRPEASSDIKKRKGIRLLVLSLHLLTRPKSGGLD